jgi:hypothetical protein
VRQECERTEKHEESTHRKLALIVTYPEITCFFPRPERWQLELFQELDMTVSR